MSDTFNPPSRSFSVAVSGPDWLDGFDLVAARLDVLLGPKLAATETQVVLLVIGGGFSNVLERWAQGKRCRLEVFRAEELPGWCRPQAIVNRAEAAVIFTDGQDKQVEDVLRRARAMRIELRVVRVRPC